jgi:hypothetical protein
MYSVADLITVSTRVRGRRCQTTKTLHLQAEGSVDRSVLSVYHIVRYHTQSKPSIPTTIHLYCSIQSLLCTSALLRIRCRLRLDFRVGLGLGLWLGRGRGRRGLGAGERAAAGGGALALLRAG